MGEGGDRVGQQPVERRAAGPGGAQQRDVDERRLRGADEHVEGAHRAVVDLGVAGPAGHPGRAPAQRGVEGDVPAELPGHVGGVDAGVEHGDRHAGAVQPLGVQAGHVEQPLHVVPGAHGRVAAAGERGLHDGVGEDADDVGAQRGQQRHPGGDLVVGDGAADQDGGVLGGQREVERLVERERVATAAGGHRPGQGDGDEGAVELDSGQAVGDIGGGGGHAGVGDRRDQIGEGRSWMRTRMIDHRATMGERTFPTFLHSSPPRPAPLKAFDLLKRHKFRRFPQ